jgi:membrane-associated phospholipid phosphatase
MKCPIRIFFRPIAFAVVFAGLSAATTRADEVTDWNQVLFQAFITDNTPQIFFTRNAAIVQASVFDAVNGIERRYTPIHVVPDAPRGASARAAAVQAAYASLVKIYPPQQSTFDAARAVSLAAILNKKGGEHEQERLQKAVDLGVQWGQEVADAIWTWRSTDGYNPPPAPVFGGTDAGEWRPTPPAFLPGRGYQFSYMTPWVIASPSQFRPAGPPALTSARYAEFFNEIKAYGSATSVVRTADQTLYSIFWQGSVNRAWSRVAIELGAERHTTLLRNALILGALNVALADATIAGFDAKYHYNFWRPTTAIPLADTDGNPATIADPNWTPLIVTPPHPDYVSTHSALTATAIAVLSHYFGKHSSFVVDSEFSPGVVRSFSDFPSAQVELNNARVYGGIHFRTACEDGQVLGTAVGRFVLRNAFQRVDGHDWSDRDDDDD